MSDCWNMMTQTNVTDIKTGIVMPGRLWKESISARKSRKYNFSVSEILGSGSIDLCKPRQKRKG
jgi:hypothetical protein